MENIYTDFYFLITRDKIDQILSDKFKDGVLLYVGSNEDTEGYKHFKILFDLFGTNYELFTNINKKTFVVEIESQRIILGEI